MMFVPPICFDRNAFDVPVAVRITDIMWSLYVYPPRPGSSSLSPFLALGSARFTLALMPRSPRALTASR